MEKQLERLLLISSSSLYGSGYLDHWADEIFLFDSTGAALQDVAAAAAVYEKALAANRGIPMHLLGSRPDRNAAN